MLYYETIDAKTLDILRELLQISEFSDLRLAGGTALALQMGHRKSIDLDFFGKIAVDEYTISERVAGLGKITLLKQTQNIHIFLINDIKVDFVNYPYSWIEQANESDGLRLAGKRDIGAMKLAAITGRGTKKDFIDLYFLLQEFDLRTLLNLYIEKFPDGSPMLVLKSLSYFEDAEAENGPFMIQKVEWNLVKQKIRRALDEYVKSL